MIDVEEDFGSRSGLIVKSSHRVAVDEFVIERTGLR
jgi:hypothetical protein